jgi:hypothetical protein
MSTFEMNDQQVAGLAATICATAKAMGQEMNPGTAAMMAEDLCAYPVPVVKAALKACRFEVKDKLAMADILQRVQIADGRTGKDEAWAIGTTHVHDFGAGFERGILLVIHGLAHGFNAGALELQVAAFAVRAKAPCRRWAGDAEFHSFIQPKDPRLRVAGAIV